MFRSLMTIIRELYLYLTNVIFMLKHLPKLRRYTWLFEMIVGVIHNTFQMQPHVISFYGVTARIKFRFFLFRQVSRN